MNYILVLISTVLLALDFAVQKKYQSLEGVDAAAGLKFNALTGLFMAILGFTFNGFQFAFSWFSLLLALGTALLLVSYSLIGFRILKTSGMAIYSIFLMIGGMLLPYFYGVLFLDEWLSAGRIIGVVLIMVAIVLSNGAKFTGKASVYLLCVAVFVLNGCVSVLSKCHQINTTFASVGSVAFVMYTGLGKFLFSSCALLFQKGKQKKLPFSSKQAGWWIVVSALLGGGSYILQLIGAKELPATVLYPLVTGGSIILSAVSGMVFYREKLSVLQIASIVLCFAGTLLFLF